MVVVAVAAVAAVVGRGCAGAYLASSASVLWRPRTCALLLQRLTGTPQFGLRRHGSLVEAAVRVRQRGLALLRRARGEGGGCGGGGGLQQPILCARDLKVLLTHLSDGGGRGEALRGLC